MKPLRNILAVCILGIVLIASAKNTTPKIEKLRVDKLIGNDGENLRINISGRKGDTPINFEQVYNIKGKSQSEVEVIKKSVLDSLGVK